MFSIVNMQVTAMLRFHIHKAKTRRLNILLKGYHGGHGEHDCSTAPVDIRPQMGSRCIYEPWSSRAHDSGQPREFRGQAAS